MLLIFIVLCTLFGRAISCSSSFPISCSCQQDGGVITITCSGSDYLEEDLEREINDLFVQKQSDPIRKLVIQNTKLSNIPEVVCRLETLEELDLSQNRLESISPVDCFTHLVQLRFIALERQQTHTFVRRILQRTPTIGIVWTSKEIDSNSFIRDCSPTHPI